MVANGRLPQSDLVAVTGVLISKPTGLALKNAIADAPWRIEIVKPAGGYRSFSVQAQMRDASVGSNIAAKQRWNLSLSSTKPLAYAGGSTHGWGTRVDLKFNGSDNPSAAQITYMKKYGFTREFGASDRNHFMHDGKTAIKRVVPSHEKAGTVEGIDYSYSRPTPAEIKAAGKKFVVRYITNAGPGNKGISQAEYDALKNRGIEIAVVYEGAAGDMKKGKAQGAADAKAAQANLKKISGLSDYLPVYFACDFDATPSDQKKINEYLDGAASVLGIKRVGIYGGYYPLKRASDAKKATYFWQTYAWSGGKVLDGAHLYQYRNGVALGSGQVDLTRALKTDYGQNGIRPVAVATRSLPNGGVASLTPPSGGGGVTTTKVVAQPVELTSASMDVIFFKASDQPEIYVYLPLSGAKRHVTAEEWSLVTQAGQAKFVTVPDSVVAKLPTIGA